MDELHALAKIINDAVKQIDESCKKRNVAFPSLDQPFSREAEAARMDPAVFQASANIASAAGQLTALVLPPQFSLVTTAFQFHVPSALRYATETNTVEILREAGPKGLHVDDVAKKAKTDANKLSRALRLLATNHIFIEVAPNVFKNNKISSLLDTGKPVSQLLAKPSEKHIETLGISAFITHITDHAFKSSAFFTDAMLDPEFTTSVEGNKAAFNKAYRTNLPIFDWLDEPENKADIQLFSMAMEGGTNLSPPDVILDGLDWADLAKGSVVVDVGGGVGSQSLKISKAHPHLKIVVQDRDVTVRLAEQFWKEKFPEALTNGQVTLQASDFFQPQPIKNASVFFMRMIMHDWPDVYCEKILKNLRAASRPDTKLLVIDRTLSYACHEPDTLSGVPGSQTIEPPEPLLPNAGRAGIFGYMSDLQMLTLTNGQERTLDQFNDLLVRSGWKLDRVFRMPYFLGGHAQLLAVPA